MILKKQRKTPWNLRYKYREQIPSVEEITKELLDGNTTHKKKSERPYNKIEGGYTKW
jgi:hypothetical protein